MSYDQSRAHAPRSNAQAHAAEAPSHQGMIRTNSGRELPQNHAQVDLPRTSDHASGPPHMQYPGSSNYNPYQAVSHINPYNNPYGPPSSSSSMRREVPMGNLHVPQTSSQAQPSMRALGQYPPQGHFYPPQYQAPHHNIHQQHNHYQNTYQQQAHNPYQHHTQQQQQQQQQGQRPQLPPQPQQFSPHEQIPRQAGPLNLNGSTSHVTSIEKNEDEIDQKLDPVREMIHQGEHTQHIPNTIPKDAPATATDSRDEHRLGTGLIEDHAEVVLPKIPSPELPLPPGEPVLLPYNPDALQWNSARTLNEQHRYCYCGRDRNLLDLDVSCRLCHNYFHGKCIRINMGPVVPFMTNYHFTCKNCDSTHNERWSRQACSWKNISASVIANLILMRIRINNPAWDKSMYAAENIAMLESDLGWYSRKADIIPFLEVPRHWAALCTEKDKAETSAWASTLGNALVSNPDLFRAHDEGMRSANAPYTFFSFNLFSFKAGYLTGLRSSLPRKRKADENLTSSIKSGQEAKGASPGALLNGVSAVPPERISARDKAITKAGDAPSFTQKIPTIKKETSRPLTVVAKMLARERKPTPKKAAITKKTEAPPAKLIRRPPPYKPQDFGAIPRAPGMTQVEGQFQDGPFYSITDIPYNKRGFKYTLCEAAPEMPAIMYRQVEVAPHAARLDWSDMSPYLYLSKDAKSATTDKGFRMGRANVGVREGQWYWEIKVLRGNGDQGGHVRIGIARREASLDGPVGFDGYSYGIRDKGGEKMHLSRPKKFMESFGTGDVIGLHLTLPEAPKTELFRDRIPIRYRQQLYFEQFEYTASKDMEDILNPGTASLKTNQPPTLKGSSLNVYKNGKLMGAAFTNLYSFWPPNSQTTRDQPAKDDGSLGYYPAVSVYSGGAVRLNFGPDFECPPSKLLASGKVRSMSERYDEQVAEDVVHDLLDEIDFERDLKELSLGEQQLEVEPIREIAEYD